MLGALQITEDDVMASAVDIFKKPAHEVAVISGRTIAYEPLSMTESGNMDFIIESMGEQYIQTGATRMEVKFKIVNVDGSNLVAADDVAFVSLPGLSMFRSSDVEINSNLITELTNTDLGIKGQIETMDRCCT